MARRSEDGFWFNSWSCKIEICQAKQQTNGHGKTRRTCGSIAYCSMRMGFCLILTRRPFVECYNGRL